MQMPNKTDTRESTVQIERHPEIGSKTSTHAAEDTSPVSPYENII